MSPVIKPDVSLVGLQASMAVALQVVESCYSAFACQCIVTGGTEAGHMPTGLHPRGLALDFNTHYVSRSRLPLLVERIKLSLGPEFDVILEWEGLSREHLHVEHDKAKERL